MDLHGQPTTPWAGDEITPPQQPVSGQGDISSLATTAVPVDRGQKQRPSGLSRRKLFLGLAGAGTAVAAVGAVTFEAVARHGTDVAAVPILNSVLPHSSSPTLDVQGQLAEKVQIGHLLRRAGFGATATEIATYMTLGYSGAVDRLLNYQTVSDDALEQRLAALKLDMNTPVQQQQWWLLRMAWTQRPLLEKMTLFWHGVLTSSYAKVGGKYAYGRMINQNNFLRSHAFDTLDNLLLGITSDPAMLVYLDLTTSHKNAPNENFAREMMELFTLGVGNYTQQDVYEAAAALTGWHVVGTTPASQYRPLDHNTQTKTYLGQTGNFDYKDVIRILAAHPKTPWYVCRRLFTFFAYENPSDEDVKPLVDAYVSSNHNMGAVMRTLLLSQQFNSQKAYRSRVKSPVEFVAGAYRSLNINANGAILPAETAVIGQTLFNPPNVAGWPGDKVSSYWLNSGTWMARLNYLNVLLMGYKNKLGSANPIDLQGIVSANHIDSPESFVDYFTAFLLDGNIDADRRSTFVAYFTSPDTTGSKQNITLTNGKGYPISRVRGTVYLILSSPEFQLN